jgi:uncharacterized RDD family membrane protein YckC
MFEHSASGGQVYAGFWIRVLAALIDSVLVAMITYPILAIVYSFGSSGTDVSSLLNNQDLMAALHNGDAAAALDNPQLRAALADAVGLGPLDLALSVVFPALAIILFWMFRSATPGKILVRSKIVDARTGGPPSKAQCIGRYFGYFVSTFPLCLGLLWVGIDKRKQGWHDKLAGTVVIREPRSHTIRPGTPT